MRVKSLRFKCYAKINLRLKVTGRRSDGYHLLSMLNTLIDFADELTLELLDEPGVVCDFRDEQGAALEELNNPELNLAAKAAQLVLACSNKAPGLKISAIKRIPSGGGLGGGSSDAAGVLKMLPSLLVECGYLAAESLAALKQRQATWAQELGADVLYLLRAESGLYHVGGIGEELSKIGSGFLCNQSLCLLLVDTPSVSSAVYSEMRKSRKANTFQADHKVEQWLNEVTSLSDAENYSKLLDLIDNDLYQPFLALNPYFDTRLVELRRLSNWAIGLSGSGSTFFAIPRTPGPVPAAQQAELLNYAEKAGFRLLPCAVLAN